MPTALSTREYNALEYMIFIIAINFSRRTRLNGILNKLQRD